MSTSPATASSPTRMPSKLSDQDLAGFQRLALSLTGIKLDDAKRSMIYTRFLRRLRALGVPDFATYLARVQQPGSAEVEHFVNTVTTNLTYFFREPHHFEFLAGTAVDELFRNQVRAAPARIWSAGSSSGEEPYSIAVTMAEAGLTGQNDYRLLCTDIDTNMVARTAAGEFSAPDVRGLTPNRISNWFDTHGERLIAKPELRLGMICRQLNLFHDWPIRPGVDIIFCRNVLIYFERADQDKIIRSFASVQHEGAYLFLGHSESLRGLEHLYDRVDNTVYRRTASR